MSTHPERRRQSPRPFSGGVPLFVSFIWSLLGVLAVIAALMAFVYYFITKEKYYVWVFLGALVAALVFTLIRLFVTSQIKCGLCHGAVVHPKRCNHHRHADKWGPLSHRQSALLRAVFTGYFSCPFCGTPYRLGKRK